MLVRILSRRYSTLGFHVLLVERLDRVPVQLQFRCHILDRRRPATPADIIGKALGVERIVRQKVELLPLHLATMPAVEAAPPFPEKSACRRMTDRARAAPCDRTSPSGPDRSSRTPFF